MAHVKDLCEVWERLKEVTELLGEDWKLQNEESERKEEKIRELECELIEAKKKIGEISSKLDALGKELYATQTRLTNQTNKLRILKEENTKLKFNAGTVVKVTQQMNETYEKYGTCYFSYCSELTLLFFFVVDLAHSKTRYALRKRKTSYN